MLQLLLHNQLYAKRSKCHFGQKKISYLEHIISEGRVSTDPEKISSMRDWPVPTNLKQLRGFLGLTKYNRKFVKGYGVISKPLTSLLKKGAYKWNEKADQAFHTLKEAMCNTPVLALPDFGEPFILETEASGVGVGAILMQKGRPIAYLSKHLCPKHQVLSIYEREFLAIMLAIQRWRHYLQGHKFIIKTDQEALKHLLDQKIITPMQQKWVTKLLGFNYEVHYKKGRDSKVADALSRKRDGLENCQAMSIVIPTWVQQVKASYEGDTFVQRFLETKALQPVELPDWEIQGDLLRFKSRIVVGTAKDLRTTLIQEMHNTSYGGHSGIHGTYQSVKRLFFWPNMKKDITTWVQNCKKRSVL